MPSLFDPAMTPAEAVRLLTSGDVPELPVPVTEAIATVLADRERLAAAVAVAAECRHAQRIYFRDRTGIEECKALERKLDRLIAEGA